MDPKLHDGFDDELDIQALLDKYLPEDHAEEFPSSEDIEKEESSADIPVEETIPDTEEENVSEDAQALEEFKEFDHPADVKEEVSFESQESAFDLSAFDLSDEKQEIEELSDYSTKEIDVAPSTDNGEFSFYDDFELAEVDETEEEQDGSAGLNGDAVYESEKKSDDGVEYDAYGEFFNEAEVQNEIKETEPSAKSSRNADEVLKSAADAVLDLGDDKLIIDEDIIAELMASDDAQFGGIEGFEDIETLSGFGTATHDIVDAEDEKEYATPEAEVDSENADINAIPDEDADEYEDYVGATINELEAENHGETDMDFIVAFGLEDELKRHVGDNRASKLKKSYDKEIERREEIERKSVTNEYRDASQNTEITSLYKKAYKSSKIKIILTAILGLVILFYENLPLIGYQLSSFLDPAVYPVVYVMVDLQITLLAVAVVYDRVLNGFGKLFRGKPSPDSIMSVAAVFSVVYSIIAASTAVPPSEPTLFNFPVVFCAFLTAVYSYLTIKREIFSFNIVSSKKPKYVLNRLAPSEAVMETAAFGDEDMGDVLKIEKVSFIDGYFYRTESANSSNRAVVLMCLGLSLVLAVLFGIYSALVNNTVMSSIMMGYAAFVTALPMSVLFLHSYPFFKANSASYDLNSTIIGENTLEEYSGASVMTFDDKLVFPSVGVKVQNVKVYNNYRFDRVLYYAASVFTKTGGPLSDVFELATLETGYSEDVLLTGIGDGYLQADVDGKSIMFGRADDLREQDVDIPEDISAEDDDEDVSVMYMIFKGKLVAKMNIKYNLDSDFEYIVKQLAGSGMSICVKTLDPNIDEQMIRNRVRLDRYPMKVIRYSSLEEVASVAERSDSGIVARGSAKGLLETVTYCDKILDAKRTNSFVCLIQAIISVVVLAVVLLTGGFSSFRSVFSVLIQAFWLIPMTVITKAMLK